jgi:enoyl-CoA hydratase/carnithine racemase
MTTEPVAPEAPTQSDAAPDVAVSTEGGVARVTLDRPKTKNAITPQMWETLGQTFRTLALDTEVRCVVITGAGGNFCSGADVFAAPTSYAALLAVVEEAISALYAIPQPVVAAVAGVAAGAGVALALGCDLVVCSDDARFSTPFVRRALSPDAATTWALPSRIGRTAALEMLLIGREVNASKALALGLVNRVVAPEELEAAVAELTADLVGLPARAVRSAKQLVRDNLGDSLQPSLARETEQQLANVGSEEFRQALREFRDRRKAASANTEAKPD